MEYRKYNTPRERIDDATLARIMNEEDLPCCSYGEGGRQGSRAVNVVGCRNRQNPTPRLENYPVVEPEDETEGNSCGKRNCMSTLPLAMSYTPDQIWQNLYCDEDAMSHGTMFTELYKPFFHGCNGNCR